MEVDYDVVTGHIVAHIGHLSRDITGRAIYSVARWLDAHDDGDPYEITGGQGTYRLKVEKCEPDRTPYA